MKITPLATLLFAGLAIGFMAAPAQASTQPKPTGNEQIRVSSADLAAIPQQPADSTPSQGGCCCCKQPMKNMN
ncbi:hypothetical protein [Cyanobium sp. ATX 6F1]|uniref:hypothetical protein n=1 Tax=unclassified Cyanobium TaxID=2627006 RepID=UPI0020CCF4EB|nr:hypothetical protein [Cyanobium sp. ATX 6F1]MCP9915305.1 hypothetical protein [Cyanobium sp. ATX 6F1]